MSSSSSSPQLTPGELDVERINAERRASIERGELSSTALLKGQAAKKHAEKVNREHGIDILLTRYNPHESEGPHKPSHTQQSQSEERKMSGGYEVQAQTQSTGDDSGLTPGEKDVAAINEERIPSVSLRGASAMAHAAKVNREKTGDPTGHPHSHDKPLPSTGHLSQHPPPSSHSKDPSLVKTTPMCHIGNPDGSDCQHPELDNLAAAQGGHLLYGNPAIAHKEKWNREHPDQEFSLPIPRYTVDDSEIREDDPELAELEINNSVQCDRCHKWRRVSVETFNLHSSDHSRPFTCENNDFDPDYQSCDADQDERAIGGTVVQLHR